MSVEYVVTPKHRYYVALAIPAAYKAFATKEIVAGKARDFVGEVDDLVVFTGDEFPKSELADIAPEKTKTFSGSSADYVVGFREKAGDKPRTTTFDPEYVAWIVDLGDPDVTGKPLHPPVPGGENTIGRVGSMKQLRRAICEKAGLRWNDEGDGACSDPSAAPDKPAEKMPLGLVEPKGGEGGGAAPLLLLLGGGVLLYLFFRSRSAS